MKLSGKNKLLQLQRQTVEMFLNFYQFSRFFDLKKYKVVQWTKLFESLKKSLFHYLDFQVSISTENRASIKFKSSRYFSYLTFNDVLYIYKKKQLFFWAVKMPLSRKSMTSFERAARKRWENKIYHYCKNKTLKTEEDKIKSLYSTASNMWMETSFKLLKNIHI